MSIGTYGGEKDPAGEPETLNNVMSTTPALFRAWNFQVLNNLMQSGKELQMTKSISRTFRDLTPAFSSIAPGAFVCQKLVIPHKPEIYF